MWLRVILRQSIQYHQQQQLPVQICKKISTFEKAQQLFKENSTTTTTTAATAAKTEEASKNQKNKSLNMVEEKPKIVFVLGPPGAGKGTQCTNIVNHYNYEHLSAGDLLREERAREGSQVGALIEECIRNGKIVPVEVTCSLLEAAMQRSGKYKFLIDGFPRNQDNLDGWNRQMADKVDFQFVLFFNCAEDICVTRCLGRGKGGSGRTDDNPESLKLRINTYVNDSLPIIKYFENLGQVREIDASCNTDEVFEKVKKVFK